MGNLNTMTATAITATQAPFWRPSAPAAPPLRVAHQLRVDRRLAASVLPAFCALILLLAAAPAATGLNLFGTQAGVAAQTEPAQSFVGAETPVSPAFVGPNSPYAYDGMSGCCVAPGSADGFVDG